MLSLVVAALSAAEPVAVEGRVAVLPFSASQQDAAFAQSLVKLLAAELTRAGSVEVVLADDSGALLAIERQRALLGGAVADGETLLQETLAVRFMVSGSLTRLGSELIVSAQVLDTQTAHPLARVVERAKSPDALAALAPQLARQLLAKPPVLQLSNQQPGVKLYVGERLYGTMPVGPIPLKAPGAWRLRTEGVDWLPTDTEVTVEAGRMTTVRLQLERYDALEAASRSLKIAGATLAVAGAGLGAGAFFLFREGAAVKRTYDGLELTEVTQAELDALGDRGQALYAGGVATATVGAAALVTGVVLLVVDPYARKLARARDVAVVPAVGPQGAGLAVVGGF